MWSPQTLALFLPLALGSSYEYPDYNGEEYDYNDYKDYQEGDSTQIPVPVFLTSPKTHYVEPGGRARLDCRLDQLGPMVVSWSRVLGTNTSYLATGTVVMVQDQRVSVETSPTSSTLLIIRAEKKDEGEYICQVSSQPPVHIKLSLRIKVPASVEILGVSSGKLKLKQGDELALVCKGEGQPPPVISWRREGKPLPDGSLVLLADQIIYTRVTSEHSGTYTCSAGHNKVNQSVEVTVLHPPTVSLDQSYQHGPKGATLELVCTVKALPAAKVEWWRSGLSLEGLGEVGGRAKVEFRPPGSHILSLESPIQSDLGVYSCSANNSLGFEKATIDVSGPGNIDQATPAMNLVADAEVVRRVEKDEENHRLLKHIVHRINKFDKLHKDLITAMRESNRYLAQLLRDQKKLLALKNR